VVEAAVSPSAIDSDPLDGIREQFVGREVGPPSTGRFPVNEVMIEHWCDAMEDRNPVYVDAEFAASSVHGGIVAPPAMLQAWIMPGLAPRPQDLVAEIKAALAARGFTSVVATNCEQEYFRYLRPGDVVTAKSVVESIADPKKTGLGLGVFVTTRTTLTDQNGQPVGTHMFRIICFQPRKREAAPDASVKQDEAVPEAPMAEFPFARPAVNEDTEFFWAGCARGELLIQRCAKCGTLRHPPNPMCPACRSVDWDTLVSTGRGTVYSYVEVHHPRPKSVPEPYVVGLIDLEEGTRFVAGVVGGDVRVGAPVEVEFERIDDELSIPRFRLAGN
jgi:uncharacterized OB-fold protein/acyl dehydratase